MWPIELNSKAKAAAVKTPSSTGTIMVPCAPTGNLLPRGPLTGYHPSLMLKAEAEFPKFLTGKERVRSKGGTPLRRFWDGSCVASPTLYRCTCSCNNICNNNNTIFATPVISQQYPRTVCRYISAKLATSTLQLRR